VHQDTVPVVGMTIEPFAGEVREGRLYGRGACDIKGAMAAMIAALDRLAELPAAQRPTIVLACTINEEHGFTGATHLAQLWAAGRSRLLPRRPDAAIVAEPTLLDVVTCHKGVVRWQCTTRGRAAHSSSPERGESAIYRMARVLSALERYAREVVGSQASHPKLGRPTLSVGTIAGGLSVNTVPAECTIEIDRRVIPGEDPIGAWRHVAEYVERAVAPELPPEHAAAYIISPGLGEGANQSLAERVVAGMRSLGRECRAFGVPFGTDAAAFGAAGVPSVVIGPGAIDQAHTADEWIAVEQLELGAEAYAAIARELAK
jgi:acetylornithine deacetylase